MGCTNSNIQEINESNQQNELNISNELSKVNLQEIYDFTNDESHFKELSGNYLVFSVYDGDTITILMPLSLEVYQFKNDNNKQIDKVPIKKRQIKICKVKIRVYGIDAYEKDKVSEVIFEVVGQKEEEYVLATTISYLEKEMETAARNLQFEKATTIRDKIEELRGNFHE